MGDNSISRVTINMREDCICDTGPATLLESLILIPGVTSRTLREKLDYRQECTKNVEERETLLQV